MIIIISILVVQIVFKVPLHRVSRPLRPHLLVLLDVARIAGSCPSSADHCCLQPLAFAVCDLEGGLDQGRRLDFLINGIAAHLRNHLAMWDNALLDLIRFRVPARNCRWLRKG